MRLLPWDPDVQTIISRIDAKVLDLQPEFQRGEVWSKSKKQRLVDSILRDWHVPPLHVVENPTSKKQEVLDGQQRLVAIRDFVRGEFEVDGHIEPSDPTITRLHGIKYRDLPDDARGQFDRFSLRIYRIVDFKSTEPAELFFRLNQPTNLTGAEQRNAFFGPVRQQIKDLADKLPTYGLDKAVLGFSNSRMAYDDVLCRVAITLERRSIGSKIAAADLVALYRSDHPLADRTCRELDEALKLLGAAAKSRDPLPRLNKATLYSWLVFIVRALALVGQDALNAKILGAFLTFFAYTQMAHAAGVPQDLSPTWMGLSADWLAKCYSDRSTSRVADVSSVALRDVVLWLAFIGFVAEARPPIDDMPPQRLKEVVGAVQTLEEDVLSRAVLERGWAELP